MVSCTFGPEITPFKAEVLYKGATCEYNNKVGNERVTNATIDETSINSGETLVFDSPGKMVLHASAIEQDPTYNDSGSTTLDIYRADLTSDWKSFILSVTVREVGENYEGNMAGLDFLFDVRLVEKASIVTYPARSAGISSILFS